MIRFVLTIVVAVALPCIDVSTSYSQNKGNKGNNNAAKAAQERKDDARIKDAREEIDQTNDKIKAIAGDIKEAEKVVATKLSDVQITRQSFEQAKDRTAEAESKRQGIDRTLSELKDAQTDFDHAAAPILEKLNASAEYQQLLKDASLADASLLQLNQRTDLNGAEKSKQAEALTARIKAPSVMKQKAIDAVAALTPLKDRVTALQTKLNQQRDAVRKAVENSTEARKAEQAWDNAKREHVTAQSKVEALRRQLAAQQQSLVSDKAQLQKAMIQDKQNDQKNNNNNKNNNRNNNNKGKK